MIAFLARVNFNAINLRVVEFVNVLMLSSI
jgi:hypothetical protein